MTHSGTPSLRVAVDIGSLIGARTGIGVFTDALTTRLAARPDVDLVAFAPTWRGRHELAAAAPRPSTVAARPMAARPLRELWRRAPLPPIEWFTGPIDVVHGPNYVVPPTRRAAAVVSVHDLTVLHHPGMCTADTLAYPSLVRAALRRGAWVHVDTDAVGAEVIEAFGADPDRVVTVPLAPSSLPADTPGADAAAGRALAGADRFVLALGTVEPRKDLPGLVAAFESVADADDEVRLVVAGPDGWGATDLAVAISASRHRSRIVRLGWVDANQRAALLRAADVLAYPSRYEGFGLPPLEAMAAGTPVVATAVPAVAETCGDAALLVPAGDTDALAGALARVLDDPAESARLRAVGPARAARFTWDATTDGLVALYRRAAGRPGEPAEENL
jgi:glycosyltransferase involved in cell wall biosynthesis